jgi:O-6-methylguanine DNA methyltransferase
MRTSTELLACDVTAGGTGTPQLFRDTIATPLGDMVAIANEHALLALEFCMTDAAAASADRTRNSVIEQTEAELVEYFAGARRRFDVALAPAGTPFQQLAWRALLDIPYGTTRSYGQQAQVIGQPTATRAVARANGDNPIAIIIPCHRVIGANGSLTGYGGGLHRKRWLLDLERGGALPL